MDNKRQKTNDNNSESELLYRNSFSDRFCDDLCEELLSFLSFEDKIRFECISKQFQRNIFNKQKVLRIFYESKEPNNLSKLMKKCETPEPQDPEDNRVFYEINTKALECVLKKFKHIKDISFGNNIITNETQVWDIITDNCRQLKTIKFDFCRLNEQSLQKIGQKLGQNLENIKFLWSDIWNTNRNFKSLIKLCPNLQAISNASLNDIVDKDEVLVKNVTKFSKLSLNLNDRQLFGEFVQSYSNTLISLDVFPTFIDAVDRSAFLRQISLLKNLEFLRIMSFDCDYYTTTFANNMKLIANNCKQLKSFTLIITSRKSLDVKHVLESFGNFTNLTKLCFSTPIPETAAEEEININCLKNCKLLTHLTLRTQKITDNLFIEIDSFVPQIKYLEIQTEEEITDNSLLSISKLKNLEVIRFCGVRTSSNFKAVTDLGLICVINNCDSLRSIYLNRRVNLTHNTIEALILLAFKNPRICFKHCLRSIWETSDGFTAIDLRDFDPLPRNLMIEI